MIKRLIRKFSELSTPMKASLALMITQFIQKGLQVVSAPLYTRLLTTEQYGQVSLFFSWYEVLVIFTGLCLSRGVFNNGMQDYKSDRDVFAFSLYSLTIISSISVGSIVTLFCKYVYNFIGLPIDLILFMFLLLTFEAALSMWTVKERFEYKWKGTMLVTVMVAITSPIVSVLCIVLLPYEKVYSRIYGERIVFLISYLIIIFVLAKKSNCKINTKYWKYALLFNIPLIPHYLSLHILNHTDQIMIANMIDKSAAGIYSVAYNGSAAIKIFWMSINASLIPWTYEKCEKQDFQKLSSVTKALIIIFAQICVLFMFLAPEVMKILSPKEYHDGIYVIPPIVSGVFFSVMYYIFANVIYYYKKPKYVMIGSVASAIINLGLNYILIPMFGYVVAGYTTMIAYVIQVIIDYFAMKAVVPEKIYESRFLIMVSGIVVIFGICLSFIYEHQMLRIVLLTICIIVVTISIFKNKELLLQFIKKKK